MQAPFAVACRVSGDGTAYTRYTHGTPNCLSSVCTPFVHILPDSMLFGTVERLCECFLLKLMAELRTRNVPGGPRIPLENRFFTRWIVPGRLFPFEDRFRYRCNVSERLFSFWGSFFYRWNVSGAQKYSFWESLSNSWVVPGQQEIPLGNRFFAAMNCFRATFILLRVVFLQMKCFRRK